VELTDTQSNPTSVQQIDSPGTEVWREEWSEGWPIARKTQWVWERFAKKLIDETQTFGNVFFCFMDEHSYSEGNCGDHFLEFFTSRGAVWVDWDARREDVAFVCSPTRGGSDKNEEAVAAFTRDPIRPYILLESPPYQGDGLRSAIWTFAMGGGHYFLHADEGQETRQTGIMGYDPHVADGDKGMEKRDWLGHASRFFNERLLSPDSMSPHNELVGGGAYCFADPGREYAVYSPRDSGGGIDLALGEGVYACRFYDPRTGEFGEEIRVHGGATVRLEKPTTADWAVRVRVLAPAGGR